MKKIVRSIAAAVMCVAAAVGAVSCAKGGGESKQDEPPVVEYILQYEYNGYGAYSVTGVERSDEENTGTLTVDIPSSYFGKPVTAISDNAFKNIQFVSAVKIPDSVAYIGSNAFDGCSALTALDIGNGVVVMGDNAFGDCDALCAVRYWGTVAEWCDITFIDQHSNPLMYSDDFYIDGARALSISVPAGVSVVRPYAFVGCDSIESLSFSSDIRFIGESAFGGCVNLSDVKFAEGLKSIGLSAFTGAPIYSVTLPSTLTSIAPYAFYGSKIYEIYNLSELQLTAGETEHGGVAQYAIDIMSNADRPSGVRMSDGFCFYTSGDGTQLLTGTTSSSAVVTLPVTEKPYKIADRAFELRDDIVKISLSESVTEIGQAAFLLCSRLVEIDVPLGMKKSGAGAFFMCSMLKTVNYAGTRSDWEKIEFVVSQDGDDAIYANTSDPLYNGAELYTKVLSAAAR